MISTTQGAAPQIVPHGSLTLAYIASSESDARQIAIVVAGAAHGADGRTAVAQATVIFDGSLLTWNVRADIDRHTESTNRSQLTWARRDTDWIVVLNDQRLQNNAWRERIQKEVDRTPLPSAITAQVHHAQPSQLHHQLQRLGAPEILATLSPSFGDKFITSVRHSLFDLNRAARETHTSQAFPETGLPAHRIAAAVEAAGFQLPNVATVKAPTSPLSASRQIEVAWAGIRNDTARKNHFLQAVAGFLDGEWTKLGKAAPLNPGLLSVAYQAVVQTNDIRVTAVVAAQVPLTIDPKTGSVIFADRNEPTSLAITAEPAPGSATDTSAGLQETVVKCAATLAGCDVHQLTQTIDGPEMQAGRFNSTLLSQDLGDASERLYQLVEPYLSLSVPLVSERTASNDALT